MAFQGGQNPSRSDLPDERGTVGITGDEPGPGALPVGSESPAGMKQFPEQTAIPGAADLDGSLIGRNCNRSSVGTVAQVGGIVGEPVPEPHSPTAKIEENQFSIVADQGQFAAVRRKDHRRTRNQNRELLDQLSVT